MLSIHIWLSNEIFQPLHAFYRCSLNTPLWHYQNSKKEVFIQHISLQPHDNYKSITMIHSELNSWIQHQQRLPETLRWLMLLNMLHIFFLLSNQLNSALKKN
ncbi:hypothetical protein D7V32_14640 [Acinetobacter tianfuensis]|uniref:Uncharacterized protein n=1 Tax=Acinetobacter tianfuensis TaxID=2419603 RepID=A0A3A8EF94_9GAMM|nr:hypothetical protein D7V32_14640 [Acinetobacter tianfuensis]